MQIEATSDFALSHLTQALESGSSISVNKDGTWHTRWEITRIFRKLFGFENQDNLAVASFLKRYLKSQEITTGSVKQGIFAHPVTDEQHIKAAITAIKKRLYPSQPAAVRKINDIKRHFYAYQARKTPQHTILAIPPSYNDQEWLKKKISKWKGKQFPDMATDISNEDSRKIDAISCYAKTVQLLKVDKSYRDFFFKFVFKNTNGGCPDSVHVAVQFPELTQRLSLSYLDKRVKRVVQYCGLEYKASGENDPVQKEVNLRMKVLSEKNQPEIQYIPITDLTKKVPLYDIKNKAKARMMSVAEIFQAFQDKNNIQIGDLEYTQEGISLCYPTQPLLDFNKIDWWKDLPPLETLTKESIQVRYKIDMSKYHSVLLVNATREKDPRSAIGNHAWISVIIPKGDDTFTLHPIGKYPHKYPQGLLKMLASTFQTLPGVFTVVDENEFYFHRKLCCVPKGLSTNQFQLLVEQLKNDFTNTAVFQHQGDNCAAWVQQTLEAVFGESFPKLFDISIYEAATPFPINIVSRSLRWLQDHVSEPISHIARSAFAYLCGQDTTLIAHKLWRKGRLSLPAELFNQYKALESFSVEEK